jgi:hypothetical protein
MRDRPVAPLHEDPIARGIERVAKPAAILCEVMAGVVSRRFPAVPGAKRVLFKMQLLP